MPNFAAARAILLLLPLAFGATITIDKAAALQTGAAQAGGTTLAARVGAAIPRLFGPGVEIARERKQYFLSGDFNGDRLADVLVLVHIKAARRTLPKEIMMLNPWGYERKGSTGTSNLALAIVHGSREGWDVEPAAGRYLLTDAEFFATPIWEDAAQEGLISVVKKSSSAKRRRPAAPAAARGDLIKVATESGADLSLYWDGKTYRLYTPKDEY